MRWPVLDRANRVELAVLAAVLAAVVVTALLLTWVANSAGSVDDEAAATARSAQRINASTDAVRRLNTTNALAARIAQAAKPLSGQLDRTVRLTRGIDDKARAAGASVTSIKGHAAAIDASATDVARIAAAILADAGTISGSVDRINTHAAAILAVAGRIAADVRRIDLGLRATVRLADGIEHDTGNIVGKARRARHESACIDREAHGPDSAGACPG